MEAEEQPSGWKVHRGAATLLAAGLLPLLVWSLWNYRRVVRDLGAEVGQLMLAGTASRAVEALEGFARAGNTDLGGAVSNSLVALLAGYLALLFLTSSVIVGASFGAALFLSRTARCFSRFALAGGLAAGLLGAAGAAVLENTLRRGGVLAEWPFLVAAGASAVSLALLALSAPVGLLGILTVLKRSLGHDLRGRLRHRGSRLEYAMGAGEQGMLPWPNLDRAGSRWPDDPSGRADQLASHPELRPTARHLYGRMVPQPARGPADTGFCVSGGGIRSSCFAQGALQVLRERLLASRYLVTVSGGGFTGGALQLAQVPRAGEGTGPASAADLFQEGSVELDHVRRHASYLTDGPGGWLKALWAVLRGMLVSFALLAACVVTLGVAASYLYILAPVADLSEVRSYLGGLAGPDEPEAARPDPPSYPAPARPVVALLVGNAVLAVALRITWLHQSGQPERARWRARVQALNYGVAAMGASLLVLAVLLPGVIWVSSRLAGAAYPQTGAGGLGAAGGLGLVATYLGAVLVLVGRRATAAGVIERMRNLLARGDPADGPARTKPVGLTERLLVGVILFLLLLGGLIVLGLTAGTAGQWDRGARLLFPGLLLVIWLSVDQTWISLHGFYRGRLAAAFAVRRTSTRGDVAARPYDFEHERTWLSDYGAPVAGEGTGLPHLIFGCAANLSGPTRTPPGRRACSYTLSWDYIGGADVGWLPTDLTEQAVDGKLASDLTVQAAMAVSGAAFASAMGTQSRAIEKILTLTNARLGTWLPNPVYLREFARAGGPWWMPGLPSIRRLTYYFRELFGLLPEDNRLLLVTDGGHYDNLGLIELLRQECRTVYCIDAGGDPPPFPQALREAIVQARAELGVEISFPPGELERLVPGSARSADVAPGDQSPPGVEELWSRVSARSVAVGTIRYPQPVTVVGPDGSKDTFEQGRIVFARALLTPDMPDELWAYAARDQVFPRDPTSDQWFTSAKFNSYLALGRHVGAQVAARTGSGEA